VHANILLHHPDTEPYEGIERLALAIGRAGRFIHLGIFYRNVDDVLHLSHMRWHCRLEGAADPNANTWLSWIDAGYENVVCEQIADYLGYVAAKNAAGQIPYSIKRFGQQLDGQGNYVPRGSGSGFTCATYVLDVFEANEIPLILVESWPSPRPEDVEWAKYVLAELRRAEPPLSEEDLAVQEAAIPKVVRFRPEEVAASFVLLPFLSEYSRRPVDFLEAQPASIRIREQVDV
jgi:hypothetical protein